jgi:hypothetical protein
MKVSAVKPKVHYSGSKGARGSVVRWDRTGQKVAGSIHDEINGLFQQYYGSGFDRTSNRNEFAFSFILN